MPEDMSRQGGTADLLRNNGDRRTEPDGGYRDGQDERVREGGDTPLLDERRMSAFRERWEASQREFVDEPRRSVETADQLVADLVRELAEQFATERSKLEGQWDRGEDVSTDDLRVAFQRYRSFFNRLLEV